MSVKEAVVMRFREIMAQRNMKPNELANLSGVTPSTVYSMLDERRKELSINVINTKLNLNCNHLRASFPVNDALHRLPPLCLGRTKNPLRICSLLD